ncbi:MAG TPA: hypothetical protein VHQ41_00275 [Patescibacteria group bacterium]|jgi:hypothetical protein|nr:hypothetical protein [Patescibacteria group bacterium]
MIPQTVSYEKLFPSQQPDEKIILAVREHWFRLFFKVFIVAVLSLLPWLVRLLLFNSDVLALTARTDAVITIISHLYFLALLVGLFVIYTLYYLNLHIVSAERIVDIDQVGLLFHEVSELNIETIEDVTSQTKGLIGNLLNYGTVFIQTAGAQERFQFDNVANPARIASIILELYESHGSKESPRP